MSESQNAAPTSLAEKLAAAKAAAAASVPEAPAGGALTTQGATGTAVAAGGKKSFAAEVETTFAVDAYIKVNKDGLGLMFDGKLFQGEIDVLIDTSEIIPHTAIKGGNPARYQKTYDGVMAKSGLTWAQAIEEIQKLDPKARPYPTADICLIPVEDVVLDGKTLAAAGSRLGYSPSTTGYKELITFGKALAAAGLDPDNSKVFAKIKGEPKSGNGNTWGVITFEYVGPYLEQ